jgi:hypothetical protein
MESVSVNIVKLYLITRDGAVAARMAHNHEVPGSSPGPATKYLQFLVAIISFTPATNLRQ